MFTYNLHIRFQQVFIQKSVQRKTSFLSLFACSLLHVKLQKKKVKSLHG